MINQQKFPQCLFFLRISIFLVMFMWTIDKLIRPEHAAGVFENFYFLSGVGNSPMYTIAAAELLLLFAFLLGIKRKFTYGAVLVFHGISTLSSFKQYLSPFEGASLLFFAAWPMLAGCYLLFMFRDQDNLFSLNSKA